MKTSSLVLCAALLLLNVSVPPEDRLQWGLMTGSPWINRMTYMFLHVNAVHLLINCYAILTMAFLVRARAWQFLAGAVIAASIPDALISDTPMLGISVLNFALVGLTIVKSNEWWWLTIINLLIICSGMMLPGIAFIGHLYGFLTGLAAGYIHKLLFTPRYD